MRHAAWHCDHISSFGIEAPPVHFIEVTSSQDAEDLGFRMGVEWWPEARRVRRLHVREAPPGGFGRQPNADLKTNGGHGNNGLIVSRMGETEYDRLPRISQCSVTTLC